MTTPDKAPSVNDVDKLSVKHAEPGTGSQFKEFIKTVISFTGDLSSLTCPAFFLNGLSLLEYGTYWGDHPSCFAAISEAQDPKDRMVAVTRWFMSTLWGSYASRCTNGLTEKKPYNPILGEQFHCKLGDVECVCEQVCHHPPISAFYLESKATGVSLNGHCGQKSRFKGTSIKVEQVGRAVLYVKNWDEQYIIDYPDLMIRGFLTGAAYLELAGASTIACSNGATATIEYIPKPWFGGEHNSIKGKLVYEGEEYATLSGYWSSKSYYTPKGGEKQLLFDAEAEPMAERVTPPVEEQQEIESHRLWGPVTAAIKEKNYSVANAEKTRIEDWQRKLRKERAESSATWEPKLFKFVKDTETRSTYEERNQELLKQMKRKNLLDDGAWTYKDSLHLRQD
ncbi:hypothetical protein BCR43DRAFT_443517 [Syncephalastrum racemosum]|uniref:Oxysterol-binding protein n=1 Tax=Syncephalastrum racemosum TaxID=13706 RepID=A0A1X2H652_SYNRA|nr:hypothetical protein BCR43DRAFT_443517 [Syncephalastrum racemosum]